MQSFKLLILSIFLAALGLSSGCTKEESTPTTGNNSNGQFSTADFIVFCNAISNNNNNYNLIIDNFMIADREYDANLTEAEAAAELFPYTMVLSGDFEYSFKVIEQVITNGDLQSTSNVYTGTLRMADFSTTDLNKIEVVKNTSGWTLKMTTTPTNNGGNNGGNNGDKTGVWQRYNSPNGYQSDLAIGNIPGEPANRVYLCEHPGSPSAGLYKGYISGETITWDAVHGLPSAKFYERDGVMRLWFSVGPEDEAGKYKKGVWTNTCGKLENSVKKVLVVFNQSEHTGIGINSVKIESVGCLLNTYNNNTAVPSCETGKTTNTPSSSSNADYYMVSITYSGEGVNGYYTRTEQSALLKSELSATCTRLKVTNEFTGRWVLTAY